MSVLDGRVECGSIGLVIIGILVILGFDQSMIHDKTFIYLHSGV